MKKILVLLSVAACLIIASCHKDTKVIPAGYYLQASKNNADWAGAGNTYLIPGDSLRLTAFTQVGEEQLIISIKFNGVGSYPLTGRQAWFYTTIGMDAITSSYKLNTTTLSHVTVSSYNAKTGIISGSFELHLLKESTDPNEYVPLDFNGGLFRLKLPE